MCCYIEYCNLALELDQPSLNEDNETLESPDTSGQVRAVVNAAKEDPPIATASSSHTNLVDQDDICRSSELN